MKRTLFAFSLLALFFAGFATVQAQTASTFANPPKSGVSVFEAYKQNFVSAVNQGNLQMAGAHRTKLVNFMNTEVANLEAVAAAKPGDKSLQADINRQKDIRDTFANMSLASQTDLDNAKTKLNLIDEFGKISDKRKPATN